MKLYNLTLIISLFLCSSAVFADTDKDTTPTTKNADTAKFLGYSALAIANAVLSSTGAYCIADDIRSGKLDALSFFIGSYLIPVPAYLAKSDAQNAWHYYQKAFSANNKIEPTSTSSSSETVGSTETNHGANLIKYSGFALINLAAIALWALIGGKAYKDKDKNYLILSVIAIAMQASSRLAVRNLYSIREHYRKLFPSKDIY
jgi:hypothetical protein